MDYDLTWFDIGTVQGLIASILIAFVIGVAFGAITKHAIKFGLALVFAIIMSIAFGVVAPAQLILLINLLKPEVAGVQNDLGLFIPLTASAFAFGFALGLWKSYVH
jgi:hypothetical protein